MIRKLCPGDKDSYIKLVGEFYNSPAVLHPIPEEYYEKTFLEIINSDVYADCYVYEDSGGVSAYALISKTYSQEAGGLCVWIEEIYVSEAVRGKGIGSALLERIIRDYPNAARFRLETEPDNTGAVRLYERFGFKPLGYSQMIRNKQ